MPYCVASAAFFPNYFLSDKTRVKACVFVECQSFDGVLEIVCIDGGLVTQVEQQEMPGIVRDARLDAEQSGVRCFCEIQPMSFYDFTRRITG